MKSYDLLIHKEIVKRISDGGYQVSDGVEYKKTPTIIITETTESPDNTKTFNRNHLIYTINMWGSANGSNFEIKKLKQTIVELLTVGDYVIDSVIVDKVELTNTVTFKEIEPTSGGTTDHYFQCILTMEYTIREE